MSKFDLLQSIEFSKNIRSYALKMTSSGQSSHIGSILSCADILGVLYGSWLNVFPEDPKAQDRDRFILSKGHAGAGVYAALALRGFFDSALLRQHYQNGSIFSGHVSHKGIPGVELSTGSLGHGLPVAAGMAKAAKIKNLHHRVVVLVSDGELDEGSNWEALLFAAHHKLSNLTCVMDYNNLQSLTTTADTLNLEPLSSKINAFGWNVIEVDGHSHTEINQALDVPQGDAPKFIIAKTTKGKGVSFMENKVLWHYRSANEDELSQALKEVLAK